MSVALERKAEQAYAMFGVSAPEFVGVGFITDHQEGAEPSVLWFELENVAETGEFLVEDSAVRAMLSAAQEELMGTEVLGRVLWHSHYINDAPSKEDLEGFPAWLVSHAMVYHVPSRTSIHYNADGEQFRVGSNRPTLSLHRTTEEATSNE